MANIIVRARMDMVITTTKLMGTMLMLEDMEHTRSIMQIMAITINIINMKVMESIMIMIVNIILLGVTILIIMLIMHIEAMFMVDMEGISAMQRIMIRMLTQIMNTSTHITVNMKSIMGMAVRSTLMLGELMGT